MSTNAHKDRVERWLDVSGDPGRIWSEIGDFGAIDRWHPAFTSCEVVDLDGVIHRHLTLENGALLLEKLVETGPNFYRYAMLEGPLPVENHLSTLTCSRHEADARIFWSSTFEPLSPDADAVIAELYEEGLEALRDRLGG